MIATDYKKRPIWREIETPWETVKRGTIWPLVPIAIGAGIWLKFNFPMLGEGLGWLLMPLLLMGCVRILGILIPRGLVFAFLFALGFFRLTYQFDHNQTEFIGYRYYGAIEGRVVHIDQSSSGALRLTLDQVNLEGRRLEGHARISLNGEFHRARVFYGARMQTTGHLGPPSGPNEPGGYNFRKDAWLGHIAAVGYSRNPAFFSEIQEQGLWFRLQNWRTKQSEYYREKLGDKIGGFVAALVVGVRSGLDVELLDDMRKSSLAHLLAISGMHVGVATGLVYLCLRKLFAFSPRLTHSMLGSQAAATLAICSGFTYLVISGLSFSAARATIMACFFFGGLIILRPSFSLRLVVYAATIILLIDPTSLFDVGFQMSFAASAALIFVYQHLDMNAISEKGWLKWLIGLALTSFVAGAATSPISAFHFHNIPRLGIFANLLAVPVTVFVVLPAIICALLLQPFGLDDLPLFVVGKGVEIVLAVGKWFGNQDNAIWIIPQGHSLVLLASVGIGLFVIIVQKKYLWAIIALMMVALIWRASERPYILVSSDAKFLGVLEGEERRFSKDGGHAFVAENWTLADGTPLQDARPIYPKSDPLVIALDHDWRIVFTTTKKGAELAEDLCDPNTIMLAAQARKFNGECLQFLAKDIEKMGGMAINFSDETPKVTPNISLENAPWQLKD